MKETRRLRVMVTGYALVIAVIVEVVSLIFTKGFHIGFVYGLALGTAVGIVNFNILAFTLDKAMDRKKKNAQVLFSAGYIVRMLIYGGVFILAYQTDMLAGVACVIGFMTVKVATYYVNFAKKSVFIDKEDRGV